MPAISTRRLAISFLFFLLFCSRTSYIDAAPIEGYLWLETLPLTEPGGLAADRDENLYVLAAGKNSLEIIKNDGSPVQTVAGLDQPVSVTVGEDGRVFVANAGRGNVEIFDSNLSQLGKLGRGDGEFGRPAAIAVAHDGRIYVADAAEDLIKVYGPDGERLFSFGGSGSGDGKLELPTAIAWDRAAGELIVADLPKKEVSGTVAPGMPMTQVIPTARIQIFGRDGSFVTGFGELGEGEGRLIKPLGVAVDGQRILVTDAYQNVVQVFDRSGLPLGMLYDQSHPLRTPMGIVAGPKSGRVFVASLHTGTVEIFGPTVTHTVALLAGEGGAVAPRGPVTVRQGDGLEVRVTPAEGYHLDKVLVDGVNVGPVLTYTLSCIVADHTLEAAFAEDSYTIRAGAQGAGLIIPTGTLAAGRGETLTFTMIPDPGHHLVDVAVDGASRGAVTAYTFTGIAADHAIEARFAGDTHVINAMTEGSGAISPAGEVVVAAGADRTFTVSPAPGHYVREVTVDGTPVGAVSAYTFREVRDRHSILASFAPSSAPRIRATAGPHGRILPSGDIVVEPGADQDFTIVPDAGYKVAALTVDGEVAGPLASYSFSGVTADHSISAAFSEDAVPTRYFLETTASGGGQITSTPAAISCPGDCAEPFDARFDFETAIVLVATPEEGMIFAGWGGDCAAEAGECRLIMDGPKTVTAYFLADGDSETFETGDLTAFDWLTGGGSDGWTVQDRVRHGGLYAAQAPGPEAAGKPGFLELPLQVAAEGEVSFWLRTGPGLLSFKVDGIEQAFWSGEPAWTLARFPVAAGRHVFRWDYAEDGSGGSEEGTAWIDDLRLPVHEPGVYPRVDVKVNTLDGPLELQASERLTVTVGLVAGDREGVQADWFIGLNTPWGWYSYDALRGVWLNRFQVSWVGPLADIRTHRAILDLAALPPGLYQVLFIADTNPSGRLEQPLVFDAARITVVK